MSRHFSKRRHTNGQQAHEKMCHITNHQKDADQNHGEMLPLTCQNGYYQRVINKLKVLARRGKKGNPGALLMCLQIGAVTVENNTQFPQKIKNRTTIKSNSSAPRVLSKENENIYSKRYMHPYIYYSLIYHSQDVEATQVSISRWMDKEDVVLYVYSGILWMPACSVASVVCEWLCDPIICSRSGSSIHWILQARILVWVAMRFSRDSPLLRNWTRVSHVSCIAGRFSTHWATWEAYGGILLNHK